MKAKIIALIIFLPLLVYSQEEANHWFFGEYAGLDFSSGSPISRLDGDLVSLEGCASISDTYGNLLFYTNGVEVWNSSHSIMPNGTGLLGDISTSQVIIIPKIKDRYYIFYSDDYGGPNGLRYSEVDITLNNGQGDVLSTNKNTLLHSFASEKICAVHHCDNERIWLMTMNYSTNSFHAYLISSSGISSPVISPSPPIDGYCCNTMKFSPNGKFLAYTDNSSNGGEDSKFFTFNNNTGEVLFHSTLSINNNTNEQHYGITFSPNNTKLYISTFYNIDTIGTFNNLYQYNLMSSDINASKLIIHTQHFPGNGVNPNPFGSLQNGPDGKIYLARWDMWPPMDTLGVINFPDMMGNDSGFDISGIPLNGRNCRLGLPNFVESYFNLSEINIDLCSTVDIVDNSKINDFKIHPNPTTGKVNLELYKENKDVQINVRTIEGKLLQTINAVNDNISFEINGCAGMYFVEVISEGEKNVFKVVKE